MTAYEAAVTASPTSYGMIPRNTARYLALHYPQQSTVENANCLIFRPKLKLIHIVGLPQIFPRSTSPTPYMTVNSSLPSPGPVNKSPSISLTPGAKAAISIGILAGSVTFYGVMIVISILLRQKRLRSNRASIFAMLSRKKAIELDTAQEAILELPATPVLGTSFPAQAHLAREDAAYAFMEPGERIRTVNDWLDAATAGSPVPVRCVSRTEKEVVEDPPPDMADLSPPRQLAAAAAIASPSSWRAEAELQRLRKKQKKIEARRRRLMELDELEAQEKEVKSRIKALLDER
jgi:hypothetical protein